MSVWKGLDKNVWCADDNCLCPIMLGLLKLLLKESIIAQFLPSASPFLNSMLSLPFSRFVTFYFLKAINHLNDFVYVILILFIIIVLSRNAF